MAIDVPPDLVQLRRDFLAAKQALHDLGASMPAPTAVATGEAELSDDQRAEWEAAHARSRDLAGEIHRHPWWGTVENRQEGRQALAAAAT